MVDGVVLSRVFYFVVGWIIRVYYIKIFGWFVLSFVVFFEDLERFVWWIGWCVIIIDCCFGVFCWMCKGIIGE